MEWGDIYLIGYTITAIITFVICYLYCIATYGFLLGLGLGWLPSGIVARIVGFLWPIIALLLLALLVTMANSH